MFFFVLLLRYSGATKDYDDYAMGQTTVVILYEQQFARNTFCYAF